MNTDPTQGMQTESMGLEANEIRRDAARRCVEIAMERWRVLKSFSATQTCLGHHEIASHIELKADQFRWMANAIRREFGIKEE